jgi:two-component system, cell cycle response regulator
MANLFAAQGSSMRVPPEFWLIGGIFVIMTAVIGFFLGQHHANGSSERAFKKARKSLTELFGLVIDSIGSAQKACGLLDSFPNLKLFEAQRERLDLKRTKLAETFTSIAEQHQEIPVEEEPVVPELPPEPVAIQWERSPEDALTKLPTRDAFNKNMTTLLEMSQQSGVQNGLLLVNVDKSEHLRSRFGQKGIEEFTRRIGSLVCRSIRDEDFVCRYHFSMFAVLFPSVDGGIGQILSQSIRDTIRNHHFRVEEGGPEVLVTASFGYTTFTSQDSIDLIVNRASTALSKSQKKGRNQLHSHDGQTMTLCAAT